MIKIGNDYEVTADKYQFILNTRSDGKDKDGNDKDSWNKTFHGTAEQWVRAVVTNEMITMINNPLCTDLNQFMDDMRQAVKEIADDIEPLISKE